MRSIFRIAAVVTIAVAVFALADARAGFAQSSSPPAELIKLERQVSLELAHVRDAGPTDSAKRKQLADAHRLDLAGEKALSSGDYKAAEDNFLQARVLIRQLDD
ncbi:MAG TPA: hypothetical protein VIX59_16230 [Candidatus Binataceae bacterium]